MDHQQATQLSAVEKYLLEEMSPEMREEFEEHFFDCQECATDLRITAEFIGAAKKHFRAEDKVVLKAPAELRSRRTLPWPKVAVWAALAASLLVIAYQNLVVLPRSRTEIAALQAPEILPTLSLVSGNSRGSQVPALVARTAAPFLLQLDIPTQERFTGYTCLLYSPAGSLVWQAGVTAQAAKDTVSIRVPSIGPERGEFTLRIQGIGSGDQPGPVELAHFPFLLRAQVESSRLRGKPCARM